ncbi:MAG: potassium transporter Kup [Hyphomicrobiaceae bacterium]|nr:potassium transporter Kup [Hyphomicrobiaceae bacterium]
MAQTSLAEPGAAHDTHSKNIWALALGSIGVVFGDIGTSPLYAFKEALHAAGEAKLPLVPAVYGILSLIFWTLILIVTLKYVLMLLRADNKGEGGTFSLMSLAQNAAPQSSALIFGLGIAGASFFYGDAVITPAISVLSAVEGLKLVHPGFKEFVVPLALMILFGLFYSQASGTAKVARYFGPICLVWFLAMGLGGLVHIVRYPGIVAALNPMWGISMLFDHGLIAFPVMGLVFLAVTGAEALYADLGHFGRKPIQMGWVLVLICLLLNYLGQGALVLANPAAAKDSFYLLYPEPLLIPMVLLATMATVIASQAVITGAFSFTRQAIQLGLLPRLGIVHTSESMAGQIYMPRVNWLLFGFVAAAVIMFQTSGKLAAAYGIAVTANMVLDSAILFFVVWKLWKRPLWQAAAVMIPLVLIEQVFFLANMTKVFEGGWLPLTMAAAMALIMLTWRRGSSILAKETRHAQADMDWLVRKLEAKPPHRVPGTAVFLTADPNAAPTALMHNLKHNRVLHERNILLTIKTSDTPRVLNSDRVKVEPIADGFIRVTARFGFMETPSIQKVFTLCRKKDLNIDLGGTSFFLSRRSLKVSKKSEMPMFQDQLFIGLARQAEDATTYFQIPIDRVVEVGTQVAV